MTINQKTLIDLSDFLFFEEFHRRIKDDVHKEIICSSFSVKITSGSSFLHFSFMYDGNSTFERWKCTIIFTSDPKKQYWREKCSMQSKAIRHWWFITEDVSQQQMF